MSCQAFSGLLQQYRNIITDVCCLELEVKKAGGGYSVDILNNQNYLLEKPATYIFLVDKQTFTDFFGNYSDHRLARRFSRSSYANYYPLYVGETGNFRERYNSFKSSFKIGKTARHIFGDKLHQYYQDLIKLKNFSSMKMCLVVFYTDSKDKAKCIESFILQHSNFSTIFNDIYQDCPKIPKIIQKAKQVNDEVEEIIRLKMLEGLEALEELLKIIEEMKEVFKDIEKKPKDDIEKKPKDDTWEILKKILDIIKIEVGGIRKEAEKIGKIYRKAKDIEEKVKNIEERLKIIKKKAEEIKEKAMQISNIDKEAEDIKEKAKNIEKIAEYIIEEATKEIINAIQIADDIIDVIKNLQSCP